MRKELYEELFKVSRAWHESEIAKHKYKIVKAEVRLLKRLKRLNKSDSAKGVL